MTHPRSALGAAPRAGAASGSATPAPGQSLETTWSLPPVARLGGGSSR
jgi:hypothetical protein